MKQEKNISLTYTEIDEPKELDPADQELLTAAINAASGAYAPYSKFMVGAALRLDSGKIIIGTNVENAAFPSGICAERNAIANASANYPGDRPVALAIAAFSGENNYREPVTPCGNCRQVIAEEEQRYGSKIRIILGGKNKIRIVRSGSDLLPLQFSSEYLRISSLK